MNKIILILFLQYFVPVSLRILSFRRRDIDDTVNINLTWKGGVPGWPQPDKHPLPTLFVPAEAALDPEYERRQQKFYDRKHNDQKPFLFQESIVQKKKRKKSCTTSCHARQFPECGTWLHYDNAADAAGSYIYNSSYVNLTCVVHSLPKPVTIQWVFESEPGTERASQQLTQFTRTPEGKRGDESMVFSRSVPNVPTVPDGTVREVRSEPVCTTMRTVTDCKFNSLGEHRVRSTCLKKLDSLDDTGGYYCRVKTNGQNQVSSTVTRVNVFGISRLESLNRGRYLIEGSLAQLKVLICANPRPQIQWINENTRIQLPAGSSNGTYAALLPYSRLLTSGIYTPVVAQRFCYISELVVGMVTGKDSNFTIMATNNVESKHLNLWFEIQEAELENYHTSGSSGMQNKYCTRIISMLCFYIIPRL